MNVVPEENLATEGKADSTVVRELVRDINHTKTLVLTSYGGVTPVMLSMNRGGTMIRDHPPLEATRAGIVE